MKKQFLKITFTALMLVMLLPVYLLAAEAADSVKTNSKGKVILISDHAEKDGITTLQFSLEVKAEANANITVEFNDSITAKIIEYRYHDDTNRLNIYISGTEPIFNGTDNLNIGTVKVQNGVGENVDFNLTVIEDSLKCVYENEAIDSQLDGEPMILVGDSNQDNKVDILDAAYIAKKVAQRKTNTLPVEYADYNEDNLVNIMDAATIAKDIARRERINHNISQTEPTVTKSEEISSYQMDKQNNLTKLSEIVKLIKQNIM